MRKAGFPADIWQVVSGAGSVVGTAIIERADYICFTGSTATGKLIAQQAASRLISCSLELGGKNPMIVLPSADIDKAAAGAVEACFSSAGQLCVSIERLYVPEELYDEFKTAFVSRVEHLSLGSALDWDADIGSLVSQAQLETVTSHVKDAVAHGATVLAGGKGRPDIGPYFYEPTVLEGVTESAECFAGETFGPLVSLYPYETTDEAVALANGGASRARRRQSPLASRPARSTSTKASRPPSAAWTPPWAVCVSPVSVGAREPRASCATPSPSRSVCSASYR